MSKSGHSFARLAERHGALWVDAGPLDGWIAWKGYWMPVRILDREPVRGDFTNEQWPFVDQCRGHAAPFLTWHCEADVISSLGGRAR